MKWAKNNLILRYLMGYVLIMAIPLALAIRIMAHSVELSYDSVYSATVARLEQSSHVIEENLDSLWNYEMQIENYLVDLGYFTLPDMLEQRDSVSDYVRIRNRWPHMVLGNISIQETAVFSRKGNCIMCKGGVLPMNRAMGETVFGIRLNGNRTEWGRFLNSYYSYAVIPRSEYDFSGRNGDCVPLVNTVIGKRGEVLGNVALFLDGQSILSMAGFTNDSGYAAAFIRDRDGNPLIGFMDDSVSIDISDREWGHPSEKYRIMDFEGVPYFVTCVNGSSYGWLYVAMVPLALVRENVGALYRSTVLLIGALVIIGAILVAVLTYTNARPIHRILMSIQQEKGEAPDYGHLDSAVAELVADSATLRKELERQIPDMRSALFSRWLHGEYVDWESFVQEYQRAGVKMDGTFYGVILLRYEHADMSGNHKSDHAIIKTLLQEEIDSVIGIYDMNYSTMVFVVKSDYSDRKRLIQDMERHAVSLSRTLSSRMKIDTLFAASVSAHPSDVNIAYEESQRALEKAAEMSPSTLPSIMWYEAGLQTESDSIYYPIEAELRMIESMKSGSVDGTARILNQIIRENFPNDTIDGAKLRQLIQMLRGTLFRFFQQVSREGSVYHNALQQIADTLEDAPDHAALRRVEDLFFSVCRDTEEINRQKNEKLTQRIDSYIEENWSDPVLSLQTMADYIGYSTAYMSRIFKQEKGESFVHYVEGYRMHKAAQMITAGDKPIEEIAVACGYASAQVFRRAFRRTYDCSPIEYSLHAHDEV